MSLKKINIFLPYCKCQTRVVHYAQRGDEDPEELLVLLLGVGHHGAVRLEEPWFEMQKVKKLCFASKQEQTLFNDLRQDITVENDNYFDFIALY